MIDELKCIEWVEKIWFIVEVFNRGVSLTSLGVRSMLLKLDDIESLLLCHLNVVVTVTPVVK